MRYKLRNRTTLDIFLTFKLRLKEYLDMCVLFYFKEGVFSNFNNKSKYIFILKYFSSKKCIRINLPYFLKWKKAEIISIESLYFLFYF